VRGDSGYLRVNVFEAKRRFGETMGSTKTAKTPTAVRWQVLHRHCDGKPVSVICPDFLIWASQLGNANDLAKITADLMEQPWINSTNWPGAWFGASWPTPTGTPKPQKTTDAKRTRPRY
jgi:hypothetical protein